MEVMIAAACLYAAFMLGRVVTRSIEPALWAFTAYRRGQAHTTPVHLGRGRAQRILVR